MRKIIIAIDGPAGSGKSTTARLVAEKLGYIYVDTGAMYRAITLRVLQSGTDPRDEKKVVKLAGETDILLKNHGGKLHIYLEGMDVTEAIRSEDVTKNVSLVSSYAELRKIMVDKQRSIGAQKGCVVDGRDIGTVVFPEADLKFFVTADVMERARRRQEELSANGIEIPLVQVVRELKDRDLKDSTRETSPMRKADDAVEIDTTNLTIDGQVHMILNYANEALSVPDEVDKR